MQLNLQVTTSKTPYMLYEAEAGYQMENMYENIANIGKEIGNQSTVIDGSPYTSLHHQNGQKPMQRTMISKTYQ